MAMIKCPECGGKISDKAKSCPKCGCPINEEKENIKIVPAKCPSCGANIEVNKDDNKTKCDFCHTNIIVDDAIKRLKIDVSGKVEVNNLPKLDDILKVGNRHYEDKEYDEAYDQYSAAVVLDPNNPIAVLRKGICKSLKTNYLKFEIESALNGYNRAVLLEKDEDKKKSYASEMIVATGKLESFVYNFYNNIKYRTSDSIYDLIVRLELCSNVYESIVPKIEDNNLKTVCYRNIVNNCTEILREKYYGTSNYKDGVEVHQKYNLKTEFENKIENKRIKYLELLNNLDPNEAQRLKEKNINIKIKNVNKKRFYILVLSIFFAYLGIKNSVKTIAGYILILNAILLLKPIFAIIFKDKARVGITVSLIIFILSAISVFTYLMLDIY